MRYKFSEGEILRHDALSPGTLFILGE